MKRYFILGVIFFTFYFLLITYPVRAASLADTDNDGIPDIWETQVFHTDPAKADTDGDGFPDGEEIKNGYDPLQKGKVKLKETDFDKDGLSDRMELLFKTDPTNPDTDGDSHQDGAEVKSGYDPASSTTVKLKKHIEINLAKQELSYFLGKVELGKFIASTGTKAHPTPKGTFAIANKNPKAWSNSAKLWMPYWMGFIGTQFGIHELPYWPDGRREGEKDLGHPASHGCVRVGRNGEAKTLYNWAEIGTQVIIK
ncbi:MAG: L,D-transpeptidase family protein [Patescibacteria group bacterium]|nr:L,D-transpeptidase family protein [Patescibacteria group bacterium]